MNVPANLKYSSSHEWVDFTSDTTAKVGLTDYAQDSLGSLVFVNLPEEGDAVTAEESFGDVESVKAVSEIMSPVSGRVVAVNAELDTSPETINAAPYEAWLVEVEDVNAESALLDAAAYEAVCQNA